MFRCEVYVAEDHGQRSPELGTSGAATTMTATIMIAGGLILKAGVAEEDRAPIRRFREASGGADDSQGVVDCCRLLHLDRPARDGALLCAGSAGRRVLRALVEYAAGVVIC